MIHDPWEEMYWDRWPARSRTGGVAALWSATTIDSTALEAEDGAREVGVWIDHILSRET